jgi:hypothetical protein
MLQRHVEPLAVGRVEDPLGLLADLPDAATLFVTGNLDPSGFPGEIVDRVPLDPCSLSKPLGERCLSRTGDAVDQDPTSITGQSGGSHPTQGSGARRVVSATGMS